MNPLSLCPPAPWPAPPSTVPAPSLQDTQACMPAHSTRATANLCGCSEVQCAWWGCLLGEWKSMIHLLAAWRALLLAAAKEAPSALLLSPGEIPKWSSQEKLTHGVAPSLELKPIQVVRNHAFLRRWRYSTRILPQTDLLPTHAPRSAIRR